MDWSLLLFRVALLLYTLAFVNTLIPMLSGRRRTVRLTPWLAASGAGAHTGALVALGIALDRCPIGTLPEVLSVLAWTAILLYLVIVWRYRIEVLHAIILPLVLVVLFVSDLLPGQVVPVAAPLQPWLRPLHLFVIILGVAALFITFAASLLYVIVDRALKAKRPARFVLGLPSLDRCESVGRTSLFWAYLLLTLGIVTGAIFSASLYGHFWAWKPQESLAILSWIILGVVVAARLGWGWRGRKVAILTIVGFAAVFLRMLGI
ncbi:MAG TPA: cytochrome c biogenesis protein CcsA [Candidatus Polarisedimenticolia bacterium]